MKPENKREDRKDRRLSENQNGQRRSVIVIRERKGKTLTFVTKTEAQGVDHANNRVAPGSVLFADEARHWDGLARKFDMGRINHQEAYSLDGKHTNMAESYFSRLRRMVRGQHHFVSPKYLFQYANHAAWLEDHRREDNGALVSRAGAAAMAAPVSRTFKGYWQRSAA